MTAPKKTPAKKPRAKRQGLVNRGSRGQQMGQPPLYHDGIPEAARKMCLLGATDQEMADIIGVSLSGFEEWKRTKPALIEALTRGKMMADANVASRLYERAMGYSHEAVKIFMPAGKEEPVYARYTEHHPPDTNAAKYWLNNRQKDRWKERQPEAPDAGAQVNFFIIGDPDSDPRWLERKRRAIEGETAE